MALVDDTVASDLTQAIVLAGVRHEETLATFDEGPKRKSRWSECKILKKGKRWGLPDDKPFKPLPYVDLPIGMSPIEIDQFLREQRLEDLHRKIQGHEMEDVDADIRPPSPPPVYDKAGNRLNTRDIRIRKAMTAEYNRLIRFMIKHVDGYLPPVDWKPAKLLKKIIIPIEKFPQAPFMGVIIGPRGVNHKRLQETTGCKIFIRGRDIGDKWQSDEEAAMPQHVHIEGETEEQILTAERLIEPLLNPETPEFEFARTHGMQQLAMVHGYALNKAEQRCGICGALGHLGYECPETNVQNYKQLAAVDQQKVMAADAAAMAGNSKQMDWKDMAAKKQEMDKNFSDMMKDVNHMGSTPVPPKAPGGPPTMAPPGGAPPVMQPPAAPSSVVDKSIICPAALVGKMIGPAGATIKKMASDTGAQVNLDRDVAAGGGKAVIITAADPSIREKAKMHINRWIAENQSSAGNTMPPPAMPPPPMGAAVPKNPGPVGGSGGSWGGGGNKGGGKAPGYGDATYGKVDNSWGSNSNNQSWGSNNKGGGNNDWGNNKGGGKGGDDWSNNKGGGKGGNDWGKGGGSKGGKGGGNDWGNNSWSSSW